MPGESIELTAAVRNLSTKTVDKLDVVLKQHITYTGETTFAKFQGFKPE